MTVVYQPSPGIARLFWLPSAILLGGLAAMALALRRPVPPAEAMLAVALAACCAITPWLFMRRGLAWDPVLGGVVWALCFMGAITVFRVAPNLLTLQLLWILLGFGGLLAVLLLPDPLATLQRYKYTWLIAGLLLATLSLVFGEDTTGTGARLWLRIGALSIQPSEVLRVLLVVFFAAYLDEKRELLGAYWLKLGPVRMPPLPYLLPLLTMVGIALLILIFQRDLGPVLLYFGTFLAMVYVATGRLSYLLIGVLLFAGAGLTGYLMSEHIQNRFAVWWDPWRDPHGLGFQSLQAMGGLAFGGLAGRGPGYGYPDFVPAAYTDYPLAAIGEEWGLLGTIGIILLYAVFVTRGLGLAARLGRDRFAQLLTAGLTTSLGIQAFIILGGSLRVIPLSGITAPFLSYGGSSMVTGLIAVGLLLRAAAEPQERP